MTRPTNYSWNGGRGPRLGVMEKGLSIRSGGAAAAIGLTALLVLAGGDARAQNVPVATAIPDRVYVVRGVSVRQGDLLALEPSFLFVPGAVDRPPPLVVVARPMLGLGGAGVGIGL